MVVTWRYTQGMRVYLLVLCLCSTWASAQDVSFRVSANFVKVPVSVFDLQGGLISDLSRADFVLRDEGLETPIQNFMIDRAPVHVLLLLDASGSLRDELDEIRKASLQFAGSFSKEDRISLISFSDRVEVLQEWTNKFGRIKKSLKRLKRGYRTALYDALLQAVQDQFNGVSGRRVIILFTDGLDNESMSPYEKLGPALNQADIMLYIVSRTRLVQPMVRGNARVEFMNRVMKQLLNDDGDFVDSYFRRKEAAMSHLAESTGGRVLFPKILEELEDSYRQVAQELKLQYVLTFQSPLESSKFFREISLECQREVGRIHYRKQYSWRR